MNTDTIIAYGANKRVISRIMWELERNPGWTLLDAFNAVFAFHEQVGYFRDSTRDNIRTLRIELGQVVEAGPDEPYEFRHAGKRYK